MKLLWVFFCITLWPVKSELVSINDHKESQETEGITFHNYTLNENGWTRVKRSVPNKNNQALRVMTFNIQNYFSRGRRHARDSTIVDVYMTSFN